MINTLNIYSNQDLYRLQLQDPRWKQKRLTILERDNYTCLKCGSKKDLHVHHIVYAHGLLPWEYPDEIFQTLCKKCHNEFHENTTISWMYRHSEMINPTPKDPDNDPLE